jgi:formamidopyrimidine-DNA glycosylase
MPELPEVEYAARTLRRLAVGRRLEAVVLDPRARRILRPATPAAVARALTGARLEAVGRHGKHLLLTLAAPGGPLGLLSHLGMTGQWRGAPADAPPGPHVRAAFRLDDGTALHYDDPRMFGRLRLVPGARFDAIPELAALGPDPLAGGLHAGRLAEVLEAGLARTRRPVKVALLDQGLLAGVGNIHAAEACWRARLDPRRRADRLTSAEVRRLARAVAASLAFALSKLDGPDLVYIEAGGENPFHVYDRAGARCRHPGCGGAIQRIVQAQRSTFYCPRCQR